MKQESPFACDMGAIEPGQREQHLATTKQLFHATTDIRELPDGYAFRLPNEFDVLWKAAKFIALERLCCPFFGFALEVAGGRRGMVEADGARRRQTVHPGGDW